MCSSTLFVYRDALDVLSIIRVVLIFSFKFKQPQGTQRNPLTLQVSSCFIFVQTTEEGGEENLKEKPEKHLANSYTFRLVIEKSSKTYRTYQHVSFQKFPKALNVSSKTQTDCTEKSSSLHFDRWRGRMEKRDQQNKHTQQREP